MSFTRTALPNSSLHGSLHLRLIRLVALVALLLLAGVNLVNQFDYSPTSTSTSISGGGAPWPHPHPQQDTSTTTMVDSGAAQLSLAEVLQRNKRDFLEALRSDSEGRLDGWVVVMGNEAGDLDSIASAIAFAYLSTVAAPSLQPSASDGKGARPSYRHVPLYQAEHADLALRPENVLAFSESRISQREHVLFLDDLPQQKIHKLSQRGLKYALVDHNRLTAQFGHDESSVVAVIDHHQDEGLYKSSAGTTTPRLIQVPTGSCSSLVAEYFHIERGVTEVPKELADLLLSAIVIDTDNVKPAPKGKATPTDVGAVEWLVRCSSAVGTVGGVQALDTGTSSDKKATANDWLESKTKRLKLKKFDLSALNTRDILRRDYKEYESEVAHWGYGLGTCPLALKEWLEREEIDGSWTVLLDKMEAWGKERNLDVVGALTSYVMGEDERIIHGLVTEGKRIKKGREILLLVRSEKEGAVDALARAFRHFEKDETLALGPLRLGDPMEQLKEGGDANAAERWRGRVYAYQQKNAEATRKQVAPAMKAAIESIEG